MSLIVILDSGVQTAHPHIAEHADRLLIGPVFGRVGEPQSIDESPFPQDDHLGHGTAVAATILDLSATARVLSIQVFHETPRAPVDRVITAFRRALEFSPAVVNLSLGTSDPLEAEKWKGPLEIARRAAVTVVAPASDFGSPSYPGLFPGVVAVCADPNVPRQSPVLRRHGTREFVFASPFPRPIAGIARGMNLSGISFATANAAAAIVDRRLPNG